MPTGWISSLIGGSFDVLGGGLNALYSADAAKKAYKRQVKLLQMQQSWQERMSNTAHQREVKDLRAAGLNPILSVTGGNGASSPVVSAPSVSAATGNPFAFNNLGKTLANSAEVQQAKTADKLAEARIKNEDRVTSSQVEKNAAEAKFLEQQTRNLKASEGNLKGPFGMEYKGEGLEMIGEILWSAWDTITRASPNNIQRQLRNTKTVRNFHRNLPKYVDKVTEIPKKSLDNLNLMLRGLPAVRSFIRTTAPYRDKPRSLFDGQPRFRRIKRPRIF